MTERVADGVGLSPGYHSSISVNHQPSLALQTEVEEVHHSLVVMTGTIQQALQILVRVEIDWPGTQER